MHADSAATDTGTDSLVLEDNNLETVKAAEEAFGIVVTPKEPLVPSRRLTEERSRLDAVYNFLRNRLSMRSIASILVLYGLALSSVFMNHSDGRLARRPAAPPRPFFRPAARQFITDYYSGNGAYPSVLMRRSELAIVAYYAPWSLHSKQLRSVFELVARGFAENKDVSFSAVNCFAPQGQCRASFKAHRFPVIVAYIGRIALVYHGEMSADYICRWISRMRNPMVRLSDEQAVVQFLSEYDSAAVAYFPHESAFKHSLRFQQFVMSSMLSFQSEHLLDKAGFAVLTSESAAKLFGFAFESEIKLYTWETIVSYPRANNYTGSAIEEWVREESLRSRSMEWIFSDMNNHMKTEQLQVLLNSGPVLILFTERELIYPWKKDISTVEQTAMEYYNCDEHSFHLRRLARGREKQTRDRRAIIDRDERQCSGVNSDALQLNSCCLNARPELERYCNVCPVNNDSHLESSLPSCTNRNPLVFEIPRKLDSLACRRIRSSLSDEKLLMKCCSLIHRGKRHQHLETGRGHCGTYRVARLLGYEVHPSLSHEKSLAFDKDSVNGLSCGRNNSLRFAALDVRQYHYILRKLAIPSFNRTTVLIVDPHSEHVYVMQDEFSRNGLRNFLFSYHNGSLDRHCATEEHRLAAGDPKPVKEDEQFVASIKIEKTSSIRFRNDLFNSSAHEDVLLFFSGGSWHGPSAAVLHIYHNVAHYFKRFDAALKFFLIDVSKNEIPWHFKMDRVPALLFFPAKRRFSSSRFPRTLPITVPNVVAFVLARCQPELRWRVALSSCSLLCISNNGMRLRRHATILRNELKALRALSATLHSRRQSVLVDGLIQRRGAQLRVAHRLAALLRSLKVLSNSQIFQSASSMARYSALLQSLFEKPLPASLLS